MQKDPVIIQQKYTGIKRTVLVVDDQSINRKILGKVLSQDYTIMEAENGVVAMDCLKAHADIISAVLLDIFMPIMNGYEVLEAMGKDPKLSKIPVIVSSQANGDENEVHALVLGAQDFIAKPYKADIIRHRLKNIITLRETASMINRVEKDELTGLYNKAFFMEKMRDILSEASDKTYDLYCLGIERFKLVNDTFGMEAGDGLLRHIADVAREFEVIVLAGRFVADEFYFLLQHQDAVDLALIDLWIKHINDYPLDIDIKVNCGIYLIKDLNESISGMCDRAKLASQENKGKYDSDYTIYDDRIRQKLLEEQFITSTMQTAIDEHQFQVYYQPKYDLNSENIAGAEALVRWIHPEKGFLSPGAFVPIFEKNGFITQMDRYVWEQACKDIRRWLDMGFPPIAISVNVSRADIFNPNLTSILMNLVAKYDVPMHYLHLEVTESAYTDNPEQIITVVKRLRALGFIIEMDDFGSGYSSLNMLAEMPVDVLKIDMGFMQMEANQQSGKGILSFVISLAKWLNLAVVAEGVETGEQIRTLRSMDCTYVQGFFFARPMKRQDFEELLRNTAVTEMVVNSEDTPEITNRFERNVKDDARQILIVDDLEINRIVLASAFVDEYMTVEAGDGQQAWDYINENYRDIDAVLLDLLMPVMDGFDVLKRIRNDERTKDLPVIITSEGNPNTEQRALELQADDFVAKPFSPEIIKQRVHNIVTVYKLQRLNNMSQELEQTRKKEETLLASIPGGIAIYRVQRDGRYLIDYMSEGFAQICGYSVSEYLDTFKNDATQNILSEDMPIFLKVAQESLSELKPMHATFRVNTRGDGPIMIRMDANVIERGVTDGNEIATMYAVHTKLSDDYLYMAEEQVRYRYLLDNLDVAYFEIDDSGRFYASDKYALYEISNESLENITDNTGLYDAIHHDDLPILFDFFKMKNQHLSKATVTLRLKLCDGTYRWTEMMGFFEYGPNNQTKRIIGVLRDVDAEWQRQNRRLQQALDNAQNANRAKTEFLSRISHEMRTPLNGILGITSIMAKTMKSNEGRTYLQQLEQSGHYLLHLIDNTLDVSKIETGRLELNPVVCDGFSVLTNIIEMVQPSIESKGITFEKHIGNLPLTMLYIDVSRTEQIIMNVLSNAVKFTPEGGTITFSIDNIKQQNGIITDRICIQDTGIGMSEKFLEHLFEPFAKEHIGSTTAYQGCGLGLTISREFLTLMEGSITIESDEGHGTTVTIDLPMPVATPEQIAQWQKTRESKQNDSLLKGKHILLFEDHPLNTQITIKLLESRGMVVDHAVDGQKGVNQFKASEPNTYDAILMDIRMPIMDGNEATRIIRGLNRPDAKTIPIIAMTANAMREDIMNALDAGMNEHLSKPVDPKLLYQTLMRFINPINSHHGQKVLVVDDLEINRLAICSAIEPYYEVVVAESGRDALRMLATHKDIMAVITDIQMPEMDGRALIKTIRKQTAFNRVAILANTIYGDNNQEEELLELGANDFIYKPNSPRVILMRLERILYHSGIDYSKQ